MGFWGIGKLLDQKEKRLKYENDMILKQLNSIDQHIKTVNHQKGIFSKEIQNIPKNKCVIILDFKENIRIGGGPIETKANFYEQKMVSDLGIVVLHKDSQGCNTKSYYNFFSEILTHDALYAKSNVLGIFLKGMK